MSLILGPVDGSGANDAQQALPALSSQPQHTLCGVAAAAPS